MPREAENIQVENKHIVGINAVDLPNTTDEDIIVNIGYCGAYNVPVGTIIEPSEVYDISSGKVAKIDKLFGCENIRCYTSSEFVTEPVINDKSIYDMELYKLTQIPHKRIYSLKIVSDNLNEADCEQYNDKDAWEKIKQILENFKNEII
jgi:hypothetical protein